MSGTILIHEDDASHAKECALYLASLADRQAKRSPKYGDEVDVRNNLEVVLAVLEGVPVHDPAHSRDWKTYDTDELLRDLESATAQADITEIRRVLKGRGYEPKGTT